MSLKNRNVSGENVFSGGSGGSQVRPTAPAVQKHNALMQQFQYVHWVTPF
jgi:hypothetical protein